MVLAINNFCIPDIESDQTDGKVSKNTNKFNFISYKETCIENKVVSRAFVQREQTLLMI